MTDSLFDPPTDRMRHRTTSGAMFIGVSQAVKLVVQMLSVIILSRLLRPEDFGILAMIAPLMAFLGMLQDLGLSQAAVQRKVLTHNQASWLFWVNAGVGVVLTLLLCAGAPLIGAFYGDSRLTLLVIAYAFFLLIGGFTAQHGALLNRQMRFRTLAVLDAVSFAIGFVVALVIAWFFRSYWALYFGTATTSVIYFVGVVAATRWTPSIPKREGGVRDLMTFGAGVTGFNLANFIARNLDNVLIGKFSGSTALGLYDRAYKLLLFPLQQINNPLSRVMLPALARLADNGLRYRSAFIRTARMVVFITQPGVLFLIITADWLVPTLLGAQWAEAAPIFQWLGLAALVQPYNSTIAWLLISQGRTAELARWGFYSATVCTLAFIAGLPWGPLGVALAYGVTEVTLRAGPFWWYVGRKGPVTFEHLWKNAAVFAPSLLAAAGVLILFHDWNPFGELAGLAASLILAYAVHWSVLLVTPMGREIVGAAVELVCQVVLRRGPQPEPVAQDG